MKDMYNLAGFIKVKTHDYAFVILTNNLHTGKEIKQNYIMSMLTKLITHIKTHKT